jgi:hypothetical protein
MNNDSPQATTSAEPSVAAAPRAFWQPKPLQDVAQLLLKAFEIGHAQPDLSTELKFKALGIDIDEFRDKIMVHCKMPQEYGPHEMRAVMTQQQFDWYTRNNPEFLFEEYADKYPDVRTAWSEFEKSTVRDPIKIAVYYASHEKETLADLANDKLYVFLENNKDLAKNKKGRRIDPTTDEETDQYDIRDERKRAKLA